MTSLLRWIPLAAVLGAACTASAADSTELAKRLHNAADLTSLDDPALKPWHLKITVQLYDAKGHPSEQGTVEEWWTPDADKRVYESPSYTATEIRDKQGLHRTKGQATPSYFLNAIRERVVHPMATSDEIDGSRPELRVEAFGKVKLDCVMLSQPIKSIAFPPLGLFPTYCLSQNNDSLRFSYRFGSESAIFNSIGTFQGRKLAIDPTIETDGIKTVSGHVVSLDGKPFDASIFTPSAGMEDSSSELTKVGPGVMAGMILNKVQPVYPAAAKGNHTTGAVHMAAIIGTDGRIHSLKIVDADDPSLAVSALTAVRQWTYKPYLLNGLPTEVDTIITVYYKMSP